VFYHVILTLMQTQLPIN